jgi:hypothetical protein
MEINIRKARGKNTPSKHKNYVKPKKGPKPKNKNNKNKTKKFNHNSMFVAGSGSASPYPYSNTKVKSTNRVNKIKFTYEDFAVSQLNTLFPVSK